MNTILTHFKPRIEAQPMFSDEALMRLSMPVVLMVGVQDAVLPARKIAERLSRLAPQLTVMLLPDMGHVLHNTANLIVPFLKVRQQATVVPVILPAPVAQAQVNGAKNL